MVLRARRIDGALIENSSRPQLISSGSSSGSAAASPHMPTMMPAFTPLSMMFLSERSTEG
jgi:hypothetical protein